MAPDLRHCGRIYFGNQAFHRVKHLLSRAKRSIGIQIFIWRADDVGREIARLLVEAAERGVRIVIHKEMTGDIFEIADDFIGTKHLKDPVWQSFWHHPNIDILHENTHDHSKVYVLDGERLLISSMNIGENDCNEWHECLVEISGRRFVEEYAAGNVHLSTPVRTAHVHVLRSAPQKPMRPVVLSLLHSAKKSIRMEMAYVSDPDIIALLARKSHEGVYVFLILPHTSEVHHHANMAAATELLKAGRRNRVFVFRYSKKFLHTKMILIDRQTLFIGSTNLMTSSLSKMGETNVLMHRQPKRCLRIVRRRFLKDLLASTLFIPEEWGSVWQRMMAWINL